MAKNKTEIKTRQGLILEGCLGEALRLSGLSFEQSVQYDPASEVPDFLIPDSKKPKLMIETHQTEARNSLMMKILRAFTAVCECKGHFGHAVTTINIVFGNTKRSFASSPMAALGAIFDQTILPRDLEGVAAEVILLETQALKCAKTDKMTVSQAVKKIAKDMEVELQAIGIALRKELAGAKPQKDFEALWLSEEKRRSELAPSPKSGEFTYFKRAVLKILFLNDEDFDEWIATKDLTSCAASIRKQAVLCGIAEIKEGLDESQDEYIHTKEITELLRGGDAIGMRRLAAAEIAASPEMQYYFADVRDSKRRTQLAKAFLIFIKKPAKNRLSEMLTSIEMGSWGGVEHRRNCLFDIISLATKLTFNDFNSAIFEDSRYPISLWNPYSNLVQHEGPMGALNKASRAACQIVNEIIQKHLDLGELDISSLSLEGLSRAVANMRVSNAVKLRKLDPLRAKARAVCHSLGLELKRITLENALFDIASEAGVGRFLIYEIRDPKTGKKVLFNSVAVHDNHGDDKSKEWGARRLATLYRIDAKGVRQSDYQDALFVLDGEWADKDVTRLHRSGWNHVVRLGDLEVTLRKVFGVKNIQKLKPITPLKIALADLEENLPIAAETKSETPKLKRKGGHA